MIRFTTFIIVVGNQNRSKSENKNKNEFKVVRVIEETHITKTILTFIAHISFGNNVYIRNTR